LILLMVYIYTSRPGNVNRDLSSVGVRAWQLTRESAGYDSAWYPAAADARLPGHQAPAQRAAGWYLHSRPRARPIHPACNGARSLRWPDSPANWRSRSSVRFLALAADDFPWCRITRTNPGSTASGAGHLDLSLKR